MYYQDTKSVFKGMTIQVADTSTYGLGVVLPTPQTSQLCGFLQAGTAVIQEWLYTAPFQHV